MPSGSGGERRELRLQARDLRLDAGGGAGRLGRTLAEAERGPQPHQALQPLVHGLQEADPLLQRRALGSVAGSPGPLPDGPRVGVGAGVGAWVGGGVVAGGVGVVGGVVGRVVGGVVVGGVVGGVVGRVVGGVVRVGAGVGVPPLLWVVRPPEDEPPPVVPGAPVAVGAALAPELRD